MRLVIDASNIRGSGGIVTHLVEMLRAAVPLQHGIDEVIVFGGEATLSRLQERPWLRAIHVSLLDGSLPLRMFWQLFVRDRMARALQCDVLFIPQGLHSGDFHPTVSMSQNLLPFDMSEAKRYGISWQLLRLTLLRWAQSKCFRKSDGVIFLTEYAKDRVLSVVKGTKGPRAVVSHGVNRQFFRPPRDQLSIREYSEPKPFRILYVSTVDMYKHQWHVVEAVMNLRNSGFPVCLDLIGSSYEPALKRLKTFLPRGVAGTHCVRYRGHLPYSELPDAYHAADLFVFASSCENMPNILLEAMAAGLPIACSNRGPMPEVLSNAGIFFDPEHPAEIAEAIRIFVDSPGLRTEKAEAAFRRAHAYTWDRCAAETLEFLTSLSK